MSDQPENEKNEVNPLTDLSKGNEDHPPVVPYNKDAREILNKQPSTGNDCLDQHMFPNPAIFDSEDSTGPREKVMDAHNDREIPLTPTFQQALKEAIQATDADFANVLYPTSETEFTTDDAPGAGSAGGADQRPNNKNEDNPSDK